MSDIVSGWRAIGVATDSPTRWVKGAGIHFKVAVVMVSINLKSIAYFNSKILFN